MDSNLHHLTIGNPVGARNGILPFKYSLQILIGNVKNRIVGR